MFARSVSLHLKPNSAAEFTQTIDKEIIPLLRKQKGFQDEITFLVPGEKEAVAISLWDQKEKRGSLSPQNLSGSAESLGQSGGGNSSASNL